MEHQDKWRNRIVGFRMVPIDELTYNPDNWRIHPQRQQEAIEGAMDEVGWIAPIINNVRTGYMIDGHARVQVAARIGIEAIPVIDVDLDPDEELKALASLDTITSMAGTDQDKMRQILNDLTSTRSEYFETMLDDMRERFKATMPTAGVGDQGAANVPNPFADRLPSEPGITTATAPGMRQFNIYLGPEEYDEVTTLLRDVAMALHQNNNSDALTAMLRAWRDGTLPAYDQGVINDAADAYLAEE